MLEAEKLSPNDFSSELRIFSEPYQVQSSINRLSLSLRRRMDVSTSVQNGQRHLRISPRCPARENGALFS
jgi:hypothetical protein